MDRRIVDEGLDDLTLDAELADDAREADAATAATSAAEVTPPAPKRTATRKPPTRKTGGSNGSRTSSNGIGTAKAKPATAENTTDAAAKGADAKPASAEPDTPAEAKPAASAAEAEEPSMAGTAESPADKPDGTASAGTLADTSDAGKGEAEETTAVIPAMPADDIWAPRSGKAAPPASEAAAAKSSPLKEGWRTVTPSERPRGNAFDVDDAFSAPPMPPDQTVRTSPFTSSKSSAARLPGSAAPAAAAASGVAAAVADYAAPPAKAFPRPAGDRSAATGRKPKAAVRRSAARQAHLTISRVEPWSVMKFSFAVSVVAFIVLFVAVAVLFGVLSALGVFDSLQHLVTNVTSSQGSAGYNVKKWFTASRILGYTVMLGGLNIVLITAMSTIGAVIYNLTSRLIGGVEVTLKETD